MERKRLYTDLLFPASNKKARFSVMHYELEKGASDQLFLHNFGTV